MKKTVGVVGLGRMGHAIAARLLAQGYRVIAYNRSIARAEPLRRMGAEVAATPRELANATEVVLSSLTDEDAVHDVCTGPSGLLSALRGGFHLSLSTLSPAAAVRLAALHDEVGVTYLSVPVQGRPMMADAGCLVAWMSGPRHGPAVDEALAAVASKVIHLGDDVRRAAAAKLALNMLMNANIELFAEAFSYVSLYGVDESHFGTGLTDTAFSAPLFQAIVQGLCGDDDSAKGSDVSVSSKDLRLLVSDGASLPIPVTRALTETFGAAEANGWGHLDPVAVRRVIGPGLQGPKT